MTCNMGGKNVVRWDLAFLLRQELLKYLGICQIEEIPPKVLVLNLTCDIEENKRQRHATLPETCDIGDPRFYIISVTDPGMRRGGGVEGLGGQTTPLLWDPQTS